MTNEQRSKLKPCPRCWHGAATAHDSEGIHTIICNRCGFWVRSGGAQGAYYDWQAQSRWYEIRSYYAGEPMRNSTKDSNTNIKEE